MCGILFLCTILWLPNSMAQDSGNFFDHFKEKASLTYGLNNRRARLLEEGSTIYGAYMGVQWGKRLKHIVTVNSTLFWVGKIPGNQGENPQLNLNYVGFAEEFIFYQYRRFDFVSYCHLGVGKAFYRERPLGLPQRLSSHWVVPTELGLQTTYHLNEWLYAKAGWGWRWVFFEETHSLDGYYLKLAAGISLTPFLEWAEEKLGRDMIK